MDNVSVLVPPEKPPFPQAPSQVVPRSCMTRFGQMGLFLPPGLTASGGCRFGSPFFFTVLPPPHLTRPPIFALRESDFTLPMRSPNHTGFLVLSDPPIPNPLVPHWGGGSSSLWPPPQCFHFPRSCNSSPTACDYAQTPPRIAFTFFCSSPGRLKGGGNFQVSTL